MAQAWIYPVDTSDILHLTFWVGLHTHTHTFLIMSGHAWNTKQHMQQPWGGVHWLHATNAPIESNRVPKRRYVISACINDYLFSTGEREGGWITRTDRLNPPSISILERLSTRVHSDIHRYTHTGSGMYCKFEKYIWQNVFTIWSANALCIHCLYKKCLAYFHVRGENNKLGKGVHTWPQTS